MRQLTSASLFSGGELASVGLMAAGFTPRWGVEFDPEIAAVAATNVPGETLIRRAQDVDYRRRERVDLLWASPECKEFSNAKAGGVEGPEQISQAQAVCDALRALTPKAFVLENVIKYRRSRSLAMIRATLDALGYCTVAQIVNCADFGVPQTRKRLIVRAVRGVHFMPYLPAPVPWVGWYAAIADLIPTLPESAFAPWQLARLPEYLSTSVLAHPNSDSDWFPAPLAAQPAFTVGTFEGGVPRAFLLSDQRSNEGQALTLRDLTDPAYTIDTRPARKHHAFLIGGGNTQLANPESKAREADDPAFTVAGNDSALTNQRAFIVHANNQRRMTVRDEADPLWTLTASSNATRQPSQSPRAWLAEGRVVKMTPRALARFQSVPDSYQLPDSAPLAAKIIGNGVPPLLAQRIGESLLAVLDQE